jgi:hypothetical protein
MNRRLGISVAIVVVAAAALLTAVALHRQQVYRDQISAAQSRFNKLDSAHRTLQADRARVNSDYTKMIGDMTAADGASSKAHDEFYSLGGHQLLALAHTERLKVEALVELQNDIDATDQALLGTVSGLYGEGEVAGLRQHISARNEAREDGFHMWWRAAESQEDNTSAAINGHELDSSSDEIARDYDESTKDLNRASQLDLTVDRENSALQHRANLEWQDAKRALAALRGQLAKP